jgi:hypothetical protein
MKLLMVILGVLSLAPLAQQRPLPANEKDLKRRRRFQRAKSIAEKISDETLKTDAISFVLYRAALAQVRKNKFEQATELAAQISSATRRAVVKIAMAQSLFGDQTRKARILMTQSSGSNKAWICSTRLSVS